MAKRAIWYVTTEGGKQIAMPNRESARAYVRVNGGSTNEYSRRKGIAQPTPPGGGGGGGTGLDVIDLARNNAERVMAKTLLANLRLAARYDDEEGVTMFTEGLETLHDYEMGDLSDEAYRDYMAGLYGWALDYGYVDDGDPGDDWQYHGNTN